MVHGGRTESSAPESTRKRVVVLASVTKNKRLVDGVPEQLAAVTDRLVRLTLLSSLPCYNCVRVAHNASGKSTGQECLDTHLTCCDCLSESGGVDVDVEKSGVVDQFARREAVSAGQQSLRGDCLFAR